jgi:hypothetical protein
MSIYYSLGAKKDPSNPFILYLNLFTLYYYSYLKRDIIRNICVARSGGEYEMLFYYIIITVYVQITSLQKVNQIFK